MSPIVIGITGFKNSGKNAVGDIIRDLLPDTIEYSFAGPLKQYAYDLDPLVFIDSSGGEATPIFLQQAVDVLGWEEAKERYPQVRRTLQRLGTEVFRKHVSQSYWPDLAEEFIHNCFAAEQSVVVTDVRFPNEGDLIRQWGGLVFRVDRKAVEPDPTQPMHASEAAILNIRVDGIIDNNGPFEHLPGQVKRTLQTNTRLALRG